MTISEDYRIKDADMKSAGEATHDIEVHAVNFDNSIIAAIKVVFYEAVLSLFDCNIILKIVTSEAMPIKYSRSSVRTKLAVSQCHVREGKLFAEIYICPADVINVFEKERTERSLEVLNDLDIEYSLMSFITFVMLHEIGHIVQNKIFFDLGAYTTYCDVKNIQTATLQALRVRRSNDFLDSFYYRKPKRSMDAVELFADNYAIRNVRKVLTSIIKKREESLSRMRGHNNDN